MGVIDMEFFFAGGVAVVLALPVILILGILVILALRHDDDPDANRAPAIYGSVLAYLALLTILFAGTGAVHALLETTSGHTHSESSSLVSFEGDSMMGNDDAFGRMMERRLAHRFSDDDDGAAITEAIGFLIAIAAAVALLFVHRRLYANRRTVAGAAARVHRAYLLIMCFTVAIIAVGAAAMALFELYEVIFKDAANIENRADELRELIPAAVLALGAGYLWRWHWDELGLDLGGEDAPPATEADVP
jgi:hypothetical protein